MTLRQVITAFVTACLVVALVGCDGPAPSLDPTLTVQVNGSDKWSSIPAGTTVALTCTTKTADTDQITKTIWSASPAIGTMLVDSPIAMNNAWVSPAVAVPTNVDITLHVETKMGGKSEMIIHLTIVPPASSPMYVFDPALFVANKVVAASGEIKQLLGEVKVNGVVISDPTLPTYDKSLQYSWKEPSGSQSFDHPSEKSPIWFAPALQLDSQTSLKIPETHFLSVTVTTKDGFSSVNNIVITVQ